MNTTRGSLTTSKNDLSTAQVAILRVELRGELARVERSLAADWPSDVQTAEERSDASADHAQVGRPASGRYDRLQQRRAELLGALERIDVGTYGTCAICGGSIPYTRLSVLPETCRCVRCCQ